MGLFCNGEQDALLSSWNFHGGGGLHAAPEHREQEGQTLGESLQQAGHPVSTHQLGASSRQPPPPAGEEKEQAAAPGHRARIQSQDCPTSKPLLSLFVRLL